jgi:colicin import membrane protein
MRHQRETKGYLQAAALSVTVHALLLLALLISVNWKTTPPTTIAEVELWDSIPTKSLAAPPPMVAEKPIEPPPVLEKPLERPLDDEVAVDIALDKKKAAEKLKKEQRKKELEQQLALDNKKKLAEIKQTMLKDELEASENKLKEQKLKKQNEAMKQLAQEMLSEDNAAGSQQALAAKAAANSGIVGEFQNKIRQKIRGNVNKSLCGNGNPELKFDLSLQPTGMLSGSPKLTKSSGISACDEAVERAIIASAPLPLPAETALFSQFRNLKLTFRPNDGN